MRLEIRADGVDFLVSRAPEPKKDGDGRQKADRDTGELLFTTELIAMDDTGGEVIRVVTAGEPKVVKKQSVKVAGLVVTPWAVDGRSGLSFRAESITPVKAGAGA